MSIFISLFAGLGLFFIGVRLISSHLRQVVGRRLRQLIARAVTGRGSLALFGLLAGAVMQSVNAVIHVLVALVTAGAMDRQRAFPIIRWANLGTSLLALVAAIDLHALALCLVGLTGMAYYRQIDQSTRWRHAVGALLGLGLLFLGTDYIKSGAALLRTEPWLRLHISELGVWLLPSFLMGAAVAWAAQSSTTVVVITMSLAAGGLIGWNGGAMLVMGAGLGSAASAWSLAGRLQGSARQLVLFQVLLRLQGLLLTLLFYAANRWLLDDPFGRLLEQHFGLGLAARLAVFYMVVQLLSDLASRALQAPALRWLEAWAAPSLQENLSRPHYVHDEALDEAETALLLADKEQQRLLACLPAYLDTLRQDRPAPEGSPALGPAERQAAEAQVLQLCEQFLVELADRQRSRDVLERCMVLRDRNRLLASLQDSLVELHQAAQAAGGAAADGAPVALLLDQLVQSLHLMLETLADTASRPLPDAEDLALLRSLTHDRSELMDGIRRRLQGSELEAGLRQAVFSATTVFERCVWLARRYVLLLDTPASSSAS
ncbi:Na/Pi symporter [Kinneretia asaccharophila]|uniref:Phosphate:Na+ symporter n=1 Tax=Roseateles asaccharophilus TaxID=582607 RepID=A0A4R6N757_9BURK|nr:Na/Pi symporter [Roseateles asaccharophilus]MDN3544166.1 Na/Pi symporter [Roseateles asaccharophilus]TDP09239.1 phosphate:Na+ symporter [Roseateles asaccharophilus]